MLIAEIAIVVTAVCAVILFYGILMEQIFDDLRANAHVISKMEEHPFSPGLEEQLGEDGLRLTLIDASGEVLYDSIENKEKMENHIGRPEIRRALRTGEGRGMRKSKTSAQHTFYYGDAAFGREYPACGKGERQHLSLDVEYGRFDSHLGDCGVCNLRVFCKASHKADCGADREDGDEYCAGG